ncbi:MAG: FHA domain-containing protein [Gemmatimonadota bacterium]|nr:MAG: FHA domain-containing protein [Gemmatimonadota bacterium]
MDGYSGLPRTGVGPLRTQPNGAALIGQFYAERNREIPIAFPVMSIGHARGNSLRIRDDRVAAVHVRIERDGSEYILDVIADGTPTTLNGRLLTTGSREVLVDGNVLGLADLEFRFARDRHDGVLGRIWVVAGVHRGKVFRVERPEVNVGRATDNDVQFPDRSVSRHHCRIREREGTWWIEDLASTNGTLLLGAPLELAEQLDHGVEIAAGFSRFVFQRGAQPLENLELEPATPCN